MKPLDAKQYFSFQILINVLIVLAIFVPFTFVLVKLPFSFLGIAALIGLLYYFFFYVLDHRPIAIECPACNGHITSNTPWICGFCRGKNNKTDEFPFLNRCEHCRAEPKAYKCHHCAELVFLGSDQLKANYASCLNLNVTAPPIIDGATQRREAKEAAEHEIQMLELATKLEATRKRAELATKKPADEIEESYMKFYAPRMGRREFARKQGAVNAEKFKDDPEMLKASEDVMKAWLRDGA